VKRNVNRFMACFAVVMVVLLAIDACLPPSWQVTNWFAIKAIGVYQVVGRPVSKRFVVCRYTPSCSDYSKGAFVKYGFWPGLYKTVGRLARCRGSVPVGTSDEP